MKIVIDIPDGCYEELSNGQFPVQEAYRLVAWIKDGIPLPKGRWIPVSERLPDVAHRVLLSGHGQVMVGMLHSIGKYSLEATGISYVYPKDDVEAWMPLPEPYKEAK